jgi:hypothetical protein
VLRRSSLVAGNVTGGGGKATTTKTYRHSVLRETQQNVKTICVLTGDVLAARLFGIQNRQIERVHVRFANLKSDTRQTVFKLRQKLGAEFEKSKEAPDFFCLLFRLFQPFAKRPIETYNQFYVY